MPAENSALAKKGEEESFRYLESWPIATLQYGSKSKATPFNVLSLAPQELELYSRFCVFEMFYRRRSHRFRRRSENCIKGKWNFGAVWNASINFPFVSSPFIFYNQTNNTNFICRITFRRFHRLRYNFFPPLPISPICAGLTNFVSISCVCECRFCNGLAVLRFEPHALSTLRENTFRLFVWAAGAALVSRARTSSNV